MIRFDVMDLNTEKYPDIEKIALSEEWAKHLIYCDMEGFHIDEDGALCLADECGNYAYCPHDRFKVIVEIKDMKTDHSFVY